MGHIYLQVQEVDWIPQTESRDGKWHAGNNLKTLKTNFIRIFKFYGCIFVYKIILLFLTYIHNQFTNYREMKLFWFCYTCVTGFYI